MSLTTSDPARTRLNYFSLLSAATLSATGNWALLVALLAWTFRIKESTTTVGIMLVGMMIPVFLLRPLANTLVNRGNGRAIGVVASLLRAAALVPLIGVTSSEQLQTLLLSVWAAAIPLAFSQEARVSLLGTTIEKARLPVEEKTLHSGGLIAMALGSAAGTLIFGRVGLQGCAAAAIATLVISAILHLAVRPSPGSRAVSQPEPGLGANLSSIQKELLLAFRHTGTQAVAVTGVCAALLLAGLVALQTSYTVWGIFVSPENVGVVLGFQAAGLMIGGSAYPLLKPRFLASSLVAGALLTVAMAEFGFAMSDNITWAAFFTMVAGSAMAVLVMSLAAQVDGRAGAGLSTPFAGGLTVAMEAAAILSVVAVGPMADSMTPRYAIVMVTILLTVLALYAFGAIPDREPTGRERDEPERVIPLPILPPIA